MNLDLAIKTLKKMRAMGTASGKFSSKELQSVQTAIDLLEIIQIEDKKVEYEDSRQRSNI